MCRCSDDDRSGRQIVQLTRNEDSIIGPDEPPTASISLSRNSSVEFRCQEVAPKVRRRPDSVAELLVVGSPAQAARPVACRQRNGIVKEEQGSPGPWLCERMLPILELCPTGDPQVPVVVADQLSLVIDQTPAVAGEETASGDGVEIAPRIDAIAARNVSQGRCRVSVHWRVRSTTR